jgi:DNA-binding transcriptional ArsR family regulator/uncharacterized protein YndB with AHSA1/START domain
MDAVFKALADASRRRLLDALNGRNGQTLRELCAGLDMTRQAVTKHLSVLESAGLVTTARRGREKFHYLNAAPINDIADRWINRYDRERARALADLKRALEDDAMSTTQFVYVTYIRTTPEKLWRALTDPAFTLRYWGVGVTSDWTAGSPVRMQAGPEGEFRDLNQAVLVAEPYRRLSYSWHTYQPEYAEEFGWAAEVARLAARAGRDEADVVAELVNESPSTVSFELEPTGSAVKLTVTHEGLRPGSPMLESLTAGWPVVLSSLKSLLETDEALSPA